MALLAMEEVAANNRLTEAAGDGAYAASVLYNCEFKLNIMAWGKRNVEHNQICEPHSGRAHVRHDTKN